MKPKLNKNLSLPWTPQGEKATRNHQILLPREKPTSFILAFLYQFFDLVGRAICDRYIIIVINTSTGFHLLVSKSRWSTNIYIYERKTHEIKMADFNL